MVRLSLENEDAEVFIINRKVKTLWEMVEEIKTELIKNCMITIKWKLYKTKYSSV